MKIGRNDPCMCGSGKKYKKCCAFIDKAYQIEYNVTFDPMEFDDNRKAMLLEDSSRLHEIGTAIIEKEGLKKELISELEGLNEKYPDVAQTYNYLANLYQFFGKDSKAEAILLECNKQVPDYFFNKILKANQFIDAGERDEVLNIFPNLNLYKTYPDRKLFHVSEMASFWGTLGRFYVKELNDEGAIECFNKAVDLDYYQPVIGILDEEIEELHKAMDEVTGKIFDFLSNEDSQRSLITNEDINGHFKPF